MIERILEWISENKNWLFEGLGVTLLVGLWALLKNRNKGENTPSNDGINQSMGNNVKAGNVTFKNNKQIANNKTDSREE
jgi:hypothetical protein